MRRVQQLRSLFRVLRTAYSSWSAFVGTALGTIALANLVFQLFRISVFDLLASFLAAYQKTFHPPVAFVFSWLPFALPPAAKDAILLYIAMGGVLYRSLSYAPPRSAEITSLLPTPWRLRVRVLAGKIFAAAVWPYFIKSIVVRPLLLVRDAQNRDRGRLPHMDRKEAEAFFARDPGQPTVFCDERELIICYFMALVIALIAVILLNAGVNDLESRFG